MLNRNPSVAPESRAQQGRRTSVLLVESDTDTREMYRDVLIASGLDVREASDGREALVHALSLRPRVAVLDARLPYIDGLELCALLRADSATESTRVILITGDSSPEHVRRCRQRGADAVFVKPVPIDTLASAVKDFQGLDAAANGQGAAGDLDPVAPPAAARPMAKARAHERYVSTNPPEPPPHLRCPQCDAVLQYDRSHVGGVSDRHPEQWDYFVCVRHGTFQYRHRTRKLRHAS